MDAHRPFEPREKYDRWGNSYCESLQAELPSRWEWEFHGGKRPYWQLQALEQLYDGGIRQADAIIEYIVTALRETGDLDETLLVICGDHGDGFGEPGHLATEPPAVSHIVPMSETLLHVPLLVRPPGGGNGMQCHHPAALTAFPDVVKKTVKGISDRKGFVRHQVYSTKQPVTDALRERYETQCSEPQSYLQPSQAVYVDSLSDGEGIRKQYYWGENAIEERIHSPQEIKNIGKITPQRVMDAFEESEAEIRIPLSGKQVTEEAKEQLAALGYY
jgi:arylsulfatase A